MCWELPVIYQMCTHEVIIPYSCERGLCRPPRRMPPVTKRGCCSMFCCQRDLRHAVALYNEAETELHDAIRERIALTHDLAPLRRDVIERRFEVNHARALYRSLHRLCYLEWIVQVG